MKGSSIVRRKLMRLDQGEPPRVLDLFSGCGGLSLGFHRAGCEIVAGVELDPHAAASHAANFHGHLPPSLRALHAKARDITETDPLVMLRELGHAQPTEAVDILVGGPPCPAFTRVGRAKLREVHRHPEAFKHDPRAKLYLPYLQWVKALRPVALLMENVPDILNFGGHNLAEEIAEVLADLGYRSAYTLLNAAHYGVPQLRERFMLLAVHESVARPLHFPRPNRHVRFPPGYAGTRAVALKVLRSRPLPLLAGPGCAYQESPVPPPDAPGPVTVEEALDDLPPILGHLDGTIRRGARRFDTPVGYRLGATPSRYAREMREWPRFEGNGEILDHVTRSLSDRDYRLFRKMRPGDDYPKAHRLARRLFRKAVRRANYTEDDPAWLEMRSRFVPPYDPGKFPNKWRKMEADQPARTLMAHLGKDGYSHIHYDGSQARVLSVREAARLQSFPDGFRFCGTMNPAFRQIGNAVPPLFAFALARSLLDTLGMDVSEARGVATGEAA